MNAIRRPTQIQRNLPAEWETNRTIGLRRLPVTGGWLVAALADDKAATSLAYVVDANWRWDWTVNPGKWQPFK